MKYGHSDQEFVEDAFRAVKKVAPGTKLSIEIGENGKGLNIAGTAENGKQFSVPYRVAKWSLKEGIPRTAQGYDPETAKANREEAAKFFRGEECDVQAAFGNNLMFRDPMIESDGKRIQIQSPPSPQKVYSGTVALPGNPVLQAGIQTNQSFQSPSGGPRQAYAPVSPNQKPPARGMLQRLSEFTDNITNRIYDDGVALVQKLFRREPASAMQPTTQEEYEKQKRQNGMGINSTRATIEDLNYSTYFGHGLEYDLKHNTKAMDPIYNTIKNLQQGRGRGR